MGNCIVTNVPVAITDLSDFNRDRAGPATGSHIAESGNLTHVNGILGINEMVKFGMIVDCARQMLYINPNGPNSSVSQSLASFLSSRGFTRIPLRLNANHHFDVEGTLNGHGTRFIVDTGASTTLVDKETAVRSGTDLTALWGSAATARAACTEDSVAQASKSWESGVLNSQMPKSRWLMSPATFYFRSPQLNRTLAFWVRNISHRISLSSTLAAGLFICVVLIPARAPRYSDDR